MQNKIYQKDQKTNGQMFKKNNNLIALAQSTAMIAPHFKGCETRHCCGGMQTDMAFLCGV